MSTTKMFRLATWLGLSLFLGCSSTGSGAAPAVGGTTAGSGGAGSGGQQVTGGSVGAGGIQGSGGTTNSDGAASGGSSGGGGRPSSGGTSGSGGALGIGGAMVGSGGRTSSGGASGGGGAVTGGGGAPGTGGAASGGVMSGGGATGSGGTKATGGTTSTGGRTGSGGTTITGGTPGTGGTIVSGGTSGTGGTTVSGGTSGTGGAPGTGGATSVGSFVNPAPGSKFFIGANFWNEGWEPASDFFASNVNWATTSNPWNPALLSDLAPYAHVLRFMDWNRTNDQVAGSWATRAQPNVAPGDRGVAYEWQIDLCNRAHVDYWINVPTLADDDHVTKLAQLIQQKLDPSLRIYIEYSNEVWNGGFPQATYADDQGVAANMPGMNQWYQGWAWYVFRSVQIFQGFEAVFGKDSPRLVKVLSGQAGYTGDASNPAPICAWHLQSLADKTVNPQGETIDAYAIAPYFAGNTTSALATDIPIDVTLVQNHVTCLKGTGIPLISYEGGQDSYAAPSCSAVATDPAMADLYVTYLNAMMAAGMSGPFTQYTHVGSCWGLKMATGDSNANAPKYQGLLNWVAAHP